MHAIKELFLENINCCHTGMNVILKIIAVCHFGQIKMTCSEMTCLVILEVCW